MAAEPGGEGQGFLRRFLATEASSGVVLVLAAVVALVWANSAGHAGYEQLWRTELAGEDLRHWVNDGLMAVFFFVVGLEVKREVVDGELREWRTAAVPVVAALGGMVVPALVYLALNHHPAEAARGWGIPMATDIAFAVGVLTLVGRRAHPALKVFLLTLAVADDIGAIVVIAVAYARHVDVAWLAAAATLVGLTVVLHRVPRVPAALLLAVGAAVWFATRQSGIHPTIAGVVLGLVTPAGARARRFETGLHPWTSYAVVPVFALANSGIRFAGVDLHDGVAARVALGTGAALVLGKFVGVSVATAVAVRSRIGRLPEGMGAGDVAGVAACAGIGFTVSIFISGLAFEHRQLAEAAKVGILAASVLASFAAFVILRTRAEAPT